MNEGIKPTPTEGTGPEPNGNPLFEQEPAGLYYANLAAKETVVINAGGTSCFAPETKIYTIRGEIPISEINVGDIVITMNENTGLLQHKPVENIYCYENCKRTIRVHLENGSYFDATEDHEIYFEGRWLMVKDIISLLKNKNDGLHK